VYAERAVRGAARGRGHKRQCGEEARINSGHYHSFTKIKLITLVSSFFRTIQYYVFFDFMIKYRREDDYISVICAMYGSVIQFFEMFTCFTIFKSHESEPQLFLSS